MQGAGHDQVLQPPRVELLPGHAAGDPPGVDGLVGPHQVVSVEDDALLVALDVADGRTPHLRHGRARYPGSGAALSADPGTPERRDSVGGLPYRAAWPSTS